MADINDGGPAFPVIEMGSIHPGMSLRDHFAGQALTGLLSENPTSHYVVVAREAYKLADAMLLARQEGGAA